MSSRSNEPSTLDIPDNPLDLTACDREPTHIPGSIQPHGFLLALDPDANVSIASRNASEYLRLPPEAIFHKTLPQLLGSGGADPLTRQLTADPPAPAARLLPAVRLGRNQTFEVVAYRTQADAGAPFTVLEFEHTREPVDTESLNARLYNFVTSVRSLQGVEAVCRAATEEIHALTGCDRVVLYRFNPQGDGQVLAEVRSSERFDSYLGLRFPAADVPAQARRMYRLNRVRIIPSVDYEPSPLLAPNGPAPEIDLSHSILRSVSPIHRQYMRNMGTQCSMSISILIQGRLWGLVSCHHHAPRYVPLRLRSACDFILQIVASQIEADGNAEHLRRALRAKAAEGKLLSAMAAQSRNGENYLEGLTASPNLLQELVQADGVAVVAGDEATLFGHTPTAAEVRSLLDFLRTREREEVFATHTLSAGYPPAAAFTDNAAGLLAVPLSRVHNTHVLWFRREQIETVRWAGAPNKPTDPGAQLDPRHSFEEWRQTVRATSAPWEPEQIQAAADFRTAVLTTILRRAEELAELAAGLKVANEELEAFSYSVSHDLRAPFRHISGFSEMLKEEEADRMSERGKHYLATIMDSAAFAGSLVDSLLEFARFARSTITPVPIPMEDLVDQEWLAVLYDEAEHRPIDFSRGPLPHVLGEPQLIRQVVRNLLSNAVKYTTRQPHPRVRVESQLQGPEFIFSVADNGVGFDQQYAGKLFGVFQRLHRIEDFQGTGIGLANVRRIISRHGGRTWAEGNVGRGATFYFSMPARFPAENA